MFYCVTEDIQVGTKSCWLEQPENEPRDADRESDTYEERNEKFMNVTRMYSTKKIRRRVCSLLGVWNLDCLALYFKFQQ